MNFSTTSTNPENLRDRSHKRSIRLRLFRLVLRVLLSIFKLACFIFVPKSINAYPSRFFRSAIVGFAENISQYGFLKANFWLPVYFDNTDFRIFYNVDGVYLENKGTNRFRKKPGDRIPQNEGKIYAHLLQKSNLHVKTVVDIGANVGELAIYLAHTFRDASILAIEGSPKNYQILKDNLEYNQLANLRALNLIVSDEADRYLFIDSDGGAESRVYKAPRPATKKVLSKTLCQIIEEYELDRIDFLKIDIEGSIPLLTNCLIEHKEIFQTIMLAFEKSPVESYMPLVSTLSSEFTFYDVDYKNGALTERPASEIQEYLNYFLSRDDSVDMWLSRRG